MQLSSVLLLASVLGGSMVAAAPAPPALNEDALSTDGIESISEYFNLLSQKVEAGKDMGVAPKCDLTKAVLPQGMSCPPDH
jgi:hypothetical protein